MTEPKYKVGDHVEAEFLVDGIVYNCPTYNGKSPGYYLSSGSDRIFMLEKNIRLRIPKPIEVDSFVRVPKYDDGMEYRVLSIFEYGREKHAVIISAYSGEGLKIAKVSELEGS